MVAGPKRVRMEALCAHTNSRRRVRVALPCGDVHRCTEETVIGATGANASPVFTLFSCGPSQPTVVP